MRGAIPAVTGANWGKLFAMRLNPPTIAIFLISLTLAILALITKLGFVGVPRYLPHQEFWLTHLVHDAGAASTKPVTVGDRITISSNGRDRVLNVVTVDKLDSQVLPISSERPTPLLLVTCRDEADPQSRPVRFLIEAGDELPALSSAKAARTL